MSKLRKAFANLIQKIQPVDYFASYECDIKAVNGDGTLDLDPYDKRLKPGPQHVELMAPAGYEKITPKTGGRCMMSFKNGSPDRPFVEFFALDAHFSEVAIRADKITLNGGTAAVARKGDSVGKVSAMDSMGKPCVFTYVPDDGPPVTSQTISLHIAKGNDSIKG